VSETQQQSVPDDFNIDAVIAHARNRSKVSSRTTLPQMSTADVLGGPLDNKSFASVEEMDASHVRRDLPAREENVKTLGDLLAKYHVGEDPDFKALLYREYPKVFPGGVIAGGYYETYDQPFTEQTVAEAYGGGQYRVVIHGPRPNSVHGVQHYASVVLKIAGDPRIDRVPRHGVAAPTPGSPAAQQLQSPPPSEGMVDKTLSTLEGIYRNERDERLSTRQETEQRLVEARREAEFRQAEAARASKESMDTMSAVYEKHNRDIVESERAAHERERRLIEERVQEREARMAEVERQREEERRRFADERRSAPDPHETISRTFSQAAELFKGDGGASQQRVLESVLQKHKEEIGALRDESTRAMERIQQANTHEAAALREAARREVEAERMSSQVRERELMRQIEAAREERQRDIDRYREDLANREQAAKDRLETQRETLTMQFDGRYETLRQQSDLRITSARDDVERMRHELDELRSSVREDKDPVAAVKRMTDLQETLRQAFGYEKPELRGIGSDTPAVATPSFDWSKAAEMLMEKGPEYLQGLGTLLRGPQTSQPTQPPLQVGQILNLPNGTFQVVQVQPTPQNPQGLGMIPYSPPQPVPTRLANPQQRALPAPQQQPQRRPQQQTSAATSDTPQPRSKGPRPARPARPAQDTQSTGAAVAPVPPPPAIKAPRPPPTDMEKQAAAVIGDLLNSAIMGGDEPEEMLAGIVNKFPPEITAKVAQYEVEDLFAILREIQPNSAVFTPAGVNFTQTVFQQLRATLQK
jgi:hypothetical protein